MRHFAVIALLASLSAACSMNAEEETIEPRAELIDSSTHALTSGTLEWLDGTYGTGCKNPTTGAARLATDAWSLRIAGTATMTNTALKVVKGDSDCVLTLTNIKGASLFAASPAIAMTASYQVSASSFAAAASARAFYANAKLSATDMAADFVVHVRFSDDLSAASGSTSASSYAQFSGSVNGTSVAAPSYTSSNTMAITATDTNTVASSSGSFTLTLASQDGDAYRVIDSELVSPTFATVDDAWTSGAGDAAVTIATGGGAVAIASADIISNGVALPAKRTIVVRRAVDGVPAYMIFPIAFSAAP